MKETLLPSSYSDRMTQRNHMLHMLSSRRGMLKKKKKKTKQHKARQSSWSWTGEVETNKQIKIKSKLGL